MLCGAIVSSYAAFGHQIEGLWNMMMMIILACQMSTVKVRFRFDGEICSMSMAFPFTFATLLYFGLRAGIIVAIFCAISQCLFNAQEKQPLYRTLFSVASLVLTVAISGSVYTFYKGLLPLPITNISAMALLGGVVTYWLANTGFISGALSLSTQKPFLPIWIANLKWSAVNFSLGGFLAVVLVHFFEAAGIGIFVIISPLLYLTHYAYKLIFVKGV
jgi:hypothetical protein